MSTDLIAIRVPPNVTHAALLDKVRERLGNSVDKLRYREDGGGGAGAGARLVSVETDDELQDWIEHGTRLVLYAD